MLMHGGFLCITLGLSVCHWTKIHWMIIHISGSIAPRVMEFDMGMYLDDIWVDREGHRSKVKVMR